MTIDINFMVGGEAGQGVQSVGFFLSKALARGGFHVFADQDYESRIRGGHNFFRVRAKDTEVGALRESVDILVALNKETIDLHENEISDRGVILYDGDKLGEMGNSGKFLSVPMERLAEEKSGNKITANTVALGAALGLTGYDAILAEGILRKRFRGDIGEGNVRALRAGYEHSQSNYKGEFPIKLRTVSDVSRMLLDGNTAIASGVIAAGCKFVAGYPMTPSTPILEYLAGKSKDFDMAVVQAEDEISAMIMVTGAAFAGVRSMTATSGSGFCLMVEGLGLAGITETPIVAVDGQRPGPAVGLPTRTEQGDLEFVIHCHHGFFPRAVLAPSTVEESFWLTAKAFNLAERYQAPVLILTDHFLATCYSTVEAFDLSRIKIDRGELWVENEKNKPEDYKRHKVTPSGVSPRAFPGLGKALVVTDSDEHDEIGHLTESAKERSGQVEKRLRKLEGLRKEISPPRLYGSEKAEVMLLGWGSTYGALKEAVDTLKVEGTDVSLLHFSEMWPFPAESVSRMMNKAKRTYAVESNPTGQLAHLLRAETGIAVTDKILRYDGRPISPAYIIDNLKERM